MRTTPPRKEKITKLDFVDKQMYQKDWEPVFQTVRIPLAAYGVDAAQLWKVRLRSDRTAMSVICISSVGFRKKYALVLPRNQHLRRDRNTYLFNYHVVPGREMILGRSPLTFLDSLAGLAAILGSIGMAHG